MEKFLFQQMSVPDFARTFNENQQNVYYWVKKYSLGKKDVQSGRRTLSADDVEMLLNLEKGPERVRSRNTVNSEVLKERFHLEGPVARVVGAALAGRMDRRVKDAYAKVFGTRVERFSPLFRLWFAGVVMGKARFLRRDMHLFGIEGDGFVLWMDLEKDALRIEEGSGYRMDSGVSRIGFRDVLGGFEDV